MATSGLRGRSNESPEEARSARADRRRVYERLRLRQAERRAANPSVAKWVEFEQAHAIKEWRRQFRGEAQVRQDSEISDADTANSNLVLWGDPASNKVLARIADKLPLKWTGSEIVAGSEQYPAATHVPILIYPNPLNPEKYVVLNSGFTYREFDYLNNARQISKLPDWAVVDITVAADERWPG